MVTLTYRGVRYEAPYAGTAVEDPGRQAQMHSALQRAIAQSLGAGSARPEDPDWVLGILESAGFHPYDVQTLLARHRLQVAVGRAMTGLMRGAMLSAMSGPPQLNESQLRAALEAEGLSPEEMRQAQAQLAGDRPTPPDGGWLVAYEGDRKLGTLRVYSEEGVRITALEPNGDALLVRDERGREHTVPLGL